MPEAPRVVLADADEPTRVGIRVALGSSGCEVIAEAVDAASAVAAALDLRPDAVLLAASLPGGGIEAARRILANVAATPEVGRLPVGVGVHTG